MTARELSDDAAMQQAEQYVAWASKNPPVCTYRADPNAPPDVELEEFARACMFEAWADSKGLGEADRLAVSTYVSYILMRGAVHGQKVSA